MNHQNPFRVMNAMMTLKLNPDCALTPDNHPIEQFREVDVLQLIKAVMTLQSACDAEGRAELAALIEKQLINAER